MSLFGLQTRKQAWDTCGGKLSSALSAGIILATMVPCAMAQNGPPPGPPQGGPPPHMEPSPEGFLFDTLGGEKITKKTDINVYYYMQEGISTNNNILKGSGGDPTGNANGAVLTPSDADVPTFEQLEQFIEKETKSNIVPGVTPTPAPMGKQFSWGFLSDTLYGRQAQGCRMTGFDYNWAMNASMGPEDDTQRNMWFCQPNLYGDVYIPVLKGVTIRAGRFADQVMIDEIPPDFVNSPNYFYSHSYGFYRVSQVFGGRVSANLYRSHKNGFLMGEFAVHNGLGTMYSMSKKLNYDYALRYRSPKMDLWIDYTGRVGYGNVKTPASATMFNAVAEALPKATWVADNFANYHVFSPNSQMMFENALFISKEFRPNWKVLAQIQYGKQFGDGAANTFVGYNPGIFHGAPLAAGFKGASFLSYEAQGVYTFNKKISTGLRLEQFRIPNSFFWPIAQFGAAPFAEGEKGALNEITYGANFHASKFANIRPEIRYDWQSGNYVQKAFGQNAAGALSHPSDSQFTAAMDVVFHF